MQPEISFKLILVRVIVYYQYEWQDKKICTSTKNPVLTDNFESKNVNC